MDREDSTWWSPTLPSGTNVAIRYHTILLYIIDTGTTCTATGTHTIGTTNTDTKGTSTSTSRCITGTTSTATGTNITATGITGTGTAGTVPVLVQQVQCVHLQAQVQQLLVQQVQRVQLQVQAQQIQVHHKQVQQVLVHINRQVQRYHAISGAYCKRIKKNLMNQIGRFIMATTTFLCQSPRRV